MRYRSALLLVLLPTVGIAQRGAGTARGIGKTWGVQPFTPAWVNPWANPYLPFAQRLAATVSGSWAGVLPSPIPLVGRFGPGTGNGSQQFPWLAAPQPVLAAGSGPAPQNAYPTYPTAPDVPIYAPYPPPPMNPVVAAPLERIGEPPSSGVVSARHAIVRNAPEPAPPQQELTSHEAYPAVVELANGYVYTVRSYWVRDGIVSFITTQFDQLQVPMGQLVRLTPQSRDGNSGVTSMDASLASSQRKK